MSELEQLITEFYQVKDKIHSYLIFGRIGHDKRQVRRELFKRKDKLLFMIQQELKKTDEKQREEIKQKLRNELGVYL